MAKWLAVAAAVALASMASPAAASGDAEIVRRLTIEWMQAVERKDRRALDRILAPDFTLRAPEMPETDAVDRATWLGNAVARDWSDFRYDHIRVDVAGDRALATSLLQFRVSPMPFALDSGIVDLWVKRDGRWQVQTRWLGASRTSRRLSFVGGLLTGLLASGLVALLLWWRKRRRRAAAG